MNDDDQLVNQSEDDQTVPVRRLPPEDNETAYIEKLPWWLDTLGRIQRRAEEVGQTLGV